VTERFLLSEDRSFQSQPGSEPRLKVAILLDNQRNHAVEDLAEYYNFRRLL